jgi:hypothetical protein
MSAGEPGISITKKEICSKYFSPIPGQENMYKCLCGSLHKQKASGYTNLMSHINNKHKADDILSPDQAVISKYIDPKVYQVYGWMDWIVTKGLPFTFCEDETNRKYCKLKPLSYKTFMKYMAGVTNKVESLISEALPNKFGLVFDGWSDSSVHYVGLFACFCDEKGV